MTEAVPACTNVGRCALIRCEGIGEVLVSKKKIEKPREGSHHPGLAPAEGAAVNAVHYGAPKQLEGVGVGS